MKTLNRIPQAPAEPLPELAEFLAPFRVHFARSEGPHALERYLTGLLTEHPNKNCDTLAQVVPGTSEQQLQGLPTAMDWDEDDGDNPNFLAGLERRRERYVVAVRCDFPVAPDRRGGSGTRADTLVQAQAARAWRVVRWREGSRGWLQARFVAVRGWRVRPD